MNHRQCDQMVEKKVAQFLPTDGQKVAMKDLIKVVKICKRALKVTLRVRNINNSMNNFPFLLYSFFCFFKIAAREMRDLPDLTKWTKFYLTKPTFYQVLGNVG